MAATAQNDAMTRLYQRLRNAGFDTPYLRNIVLPSWWDDQNSSSPTAYQEVLLFLAKHLGISIRTLADENAPIALRDLGPCNFKKSRSAKNDELAIARTIATRAAQIAAAAMSRSASPELPISGEQIRESILSKGARWVDLNSLLDWCWDSGIPVLHVSHFPSGAKKMDGMAGMVDGRPVIVLSKHCKQEAWLLFILAHELGHIVRGHVSQDGMLIDEHIVHDNVDAQEQEANSTATAILTGDPDRRFAWHGRWPNASELASGAACHGAKNQIDPGHIVLNYVNHRGNEFHALGNAALAKLHPHANAHKIIEDKMMANLDWGGLPEDSAEFLVRVTTPRTK